MLKRLLARYHSRRLVVFAIAVLGVSGCDLMPRPEPNPVASVSVAPTITMAEAVALAEPQDAALSTSRPVFVRAATYDGAKYCDGGPALCRDIRGTVWVVTFTISAQEGSRVSIVLDGRTGRFLIARQ